MGMALCGIFSNAVMSKEVADQLRSSFSIQLQQIMATQVTSNIGEIHSVVSQAFIVCLKRAAELPSLDPRALASFLIDSLKPLDGAAGQILSTGITSSAQLANFLVELDALTQTLEK